MMCSTVSSNCLQILHCYLFLFVIFLSPDDVMPDLVLLFYIIIIIIIIITTTIIINIIIIIIIIRRRRRRRNLQCKMKNYH